MVIGNEAEPKTNCLECDRPMETEVLRSNAGYYIGSQCDRCGPHTRESDYFPSRPAAEAELAFWNSTGVKPNARTPGYWGSATP
jgi:hypothetical protein